MGKKKQKLVYDDNIESLHSSLGPLGVELSLSTLYVHTCLLFTCLFTSLQLTIDTNKAAVNLVSLFHGMCVCGL